MYWFKLGEVWLCIRGVGSLCRSSQVSEGGALGIQVRLMY